MIQQRQIPSKHPDSKYTYVYYTYLKFRENAIPTFLDNKATVPVGALLHTVSTNVGTHNWSLGIENVVIQTL